MSTKGEAPPDAASGAWPRYFEDSDNSGHRYIVEWDRREDWRKWRDLPEDDESGWEEPEWATRIDGGTLTFTDPRIDRW